MEVSKVYTMDHSGEELDQAIEKVNSGYFLPEGTKEITRNGIVDVKQYASANVNVPQNVTGIVRSATGQYTPAEDMDFKNFSLTFDFIPKVFLFWANLTSQQENTGGSVTGGFFFNDCGDLKEISGLGVISSILENPVFMGYDSIESDDGLSPLPCFKLSNQTILPSTFFEEGGSMEKQNFILTSATTYLWFALG